MDDIPKVTTFDLTSLLWAVMNSDYVKARTIAREMNPGERAEAVIQLDLARSMLTNRFGGDLGSDR